MRNTKLKHNANHVGVAVLGDPQKRKTKFNANTVGAGLVPAQNEKGITLIALIITIIVMLILVGVTINVALNGGLFKKASDAAKDTSIEATREELMSIVFGTIENDGTFDAIKTKRALEGAGATVPNSEFPLQVTYKGQEFEISAEGKITPKDKSDENKGDEVTLADILSLNYEPGAEEEGIIFNVGDIANLFGVESLNNYTYLHTDDEMTCLNSFLHIEISDPNVENLHDFFAQGYGGNDKDKISGQFILGLIHNQPSEGKFEFWVVDKENFVGSHFYNTAEQINDFKNRFGNVTIKLVPNS